MPILLFIDLFFWTILALLILPVTIIGIIAAKKNRSILIWILIGALFNFFAILVGFFTTAGAMALFLSALSIFIAYIIPKRDNDAHFKGSSKYDDNSNLNADFAFDKDSEANVCPRCSANISSYTTTCPICDFPLENPAHIMTQATTNTKRQSADDSKKETFHFATRAPASSEKKQAIKYKKCPTCKKKIEGTATLCPFCTSPV